MFQRKESLPARGRMRSHSVSCLFVTCASLLQSRGYNGLQHVARHKANVQMTRKGKERALRRVQHEKALHTPNTSTTK